MNRVFAFITVYMPDDSVRQHIEGISMQTSKTFVCDNSATGNDALFQDQSITYIPNERNFGLPGAFNRALQGLHNQIDNADFIIFFDQDSSIEPGYIQKMCDEYIEVEKMFPNLGCLGPAFFNSSSNTVEFPKLKKFLTSYSYKVDNIITSSMLMRFENLKKIGFWNENLFLDLADWDLCWRLEKQRMICAITDKVVLKHAVGNGEKKIGPLKLRVGQPFREYYQTRDAYYLLAENYVPLKMRLRLLATVVIRPVLHMLFLEDKKQRMYYIQKGRKDYKKGIHGELTDMEL